MKQLFFLVLLVVVNFYTTSTFAVNYKQDEAAELKFLLNNKTAKTGMPLSFQIPDNYWLLIGSNPIDPENTAERILATYGQNIYDAACWQLALAVLGQTSVADQQTARLISGKSGDIANLRASARDFTYGDGNQTMTDTDAFFFRMITDTYQNIDPLTGQKVDWMDWKPVMGENAWAALIGPLQVAYAKYKGKVPLDSAEVKLATSILPSLKAMQSPIGAVYHAPNGTFDKNPHDISTENNASLYAGLVMLKQILKSGGDPDGLNDRYVNSLVKGIDSYFQMYAYDPQLGAIVQGGLYDDPSSPGKFVPSKDFAVDVQTWGITVIGAQKIDAWFGEGTSYQIWQKTKKAAGYYDNTVLQGVGYTDAPNEIISVEWTLGAILLVKELNTYYKGQYQDLVDDANSMRAGIESLKETVVVGGEEAKAFDYASKRYFIPFGWYANKVPSLTSTAWAIMVDRDFNPFVLGGATVPSS